MGQPVKVDKRPQKDERTIKSCICRWFYQQKMWALEGGPNARCVGPTSQRIKETTIWYSWGVPRVEGPHFFCFVWSARIMSEGRYSSLLSWQWTPPTALVISEACQSHLYGWLLSTKNLHVFFSNKRRYDILNRRLLQYIVRIPFGPLPSGVLLEKNCRQK